jgi:hypothetical protein
LFTRQENNTGPKSKTGDITLAATEGKMPSRVKSKIEVGQEISQLSELDARVLLILCTELVNFCANVARQIDPAAAAMLAYLRDDIRLENKSLLP